MASRSTVPGSNGTDDTTGNPWRKAGIDALPGGLCAYAAETSGVTITSLADIITVTFTANGSRTYEVRGLVSAASDTANDVVRITLTDGANGGLNQGVREFVITNATKAFPIEFSCIDQPSSGSTTYKIRGSRVSGSGVVTTGGTSSGSTIRVYDVGPSF